MKLTNVEWSVKTGDDGSISVIEKAPHGGDATIATVEDAQTAELIALSPQMLRVLLSLRPMVSRNAVSRGAEDFASVLSRLVEWYDAQVEPVLDIAFAQNITGDVAEIHLYAWRYIDRTRGTRNNLLDDERHLADGWSILNCHKGKDGILPTISGEENYADYESAIAAATKRAARFDAKIVEL